MSFLRVFSSHCSVLFYSCSRIICPIIILARYVSVSWNYHVLLTTCNKAYRRNTIRDSLFHYCKEISAITACFEHIKDRILPASVSSIFFIFFIFSFSSVDFHPSPLVFFPEMWRICVISFDFSIESRHIPSTNEEYVKVSLLRSLPML